MAFDYEKYLRTTTTLWCWGCGDGVIMKAVFRAIEKLEWNMDDVAVVSGIGCSGRFSSYIDANTVHTTHGRTIAYATGIKLANPDKHVLVVAGDGDGLAIGGNHTIHGARRNIDLNFILINNFIYGLTNSQTSPTTPQGMWTVSAQYDNIDPTFDACKLGEAAGASFVGRETVLDPKKLEKLFVAGFKHRGFAFFDIFSNCHVNLGRKNKMASAMENLNWIDSITVSKTKFEKMSEEERKGLFPTGILHHDDEVEEYCDLYDKVIEAAQSGKKVRDL
jgi:2-oxoglutarate ferredoxin oxidoreductase subunit beta